MKLQPKTVISDRYEIIKLIGVGGMANVYCANDLKLDRKVSFKVLKEEFVDEEFIGKFSKEARAAARISHVNIANVYDVGNDGNIYYIVMEYVDGYTLKEIIKEKAPFDNEEVIGIAIQIANALEVAHSYNIVHRDIKPQNILVTKDGDVKVTDFGIARATTSNTITTDTMGSVHYFSPEQARGGYVDFKSDIYSLGIIMFEMITGKLPFDGDGVVQLAMKHINDPLPNMRLLNPKISTSLEKIIIKATEKNGDNRYNSVKELNKDLKMALTDSSGSFVTQKVIPEDNPTVVIRPEELEQIKNMTKQQNNVNNLNNVNNTNNVNNPKNNINNQQDKIYRQGASNLNNQNNNKPKISPIADNQSKSMERKVTIWAIVTSLALIGVITGFLIVWLLSSGNSKVPDFTGKTWEEAIAIAKDKEIYITNTKEEYSDEIEEGCIVAQDVEPGEKIEKGQNINVTLSLGTGKFELEDFVGLDISEVYKIVEDVQIELKEEYIYDETIEIGKVVKQIPDAGTTISPGDKVTLYVSRGSEKEVQESIIVPNLIGLDEEEAKVKIKEEGLSVGKIRKEASDNVEKGKVIDQSISFGNEVSEDTPISIVVSSGKKESTTTETKTETTTEPILKETTTITTTQAVTETKVETTTETITEQTTTPALKTETLVINPTLPDGVDSVEVKVVKTVDGQSTTVWSSNHSASKFPLEISVSGNKPTQFELYIDGKLIGTETKSFS